MLVGRYKGRAAVALGAVLLGGLLASLPVQADVRAWLSATRIAPGDTVQLTLEHSGQSSAQPDLSPLQRDFDVLGTSSSTRIQIDNGNASSATDVILTLSPKRAGRLSIPSIRWDGEQTQPLQLDVSGAAGAPGGNAATGAPAAFIETQVDPLQPLVQAAVHLTVRLYAAEPLYHADLTLPGSGNVLVQQVGSDEQGSTDRNGRTYQVFTRHYLLFPQHSGTLQLAGPVLNAQVAVRSPNTFGADPFAGLFGGSPFAGLLNMRPVRLHGNPIELQVRPRPAAATASYWLPAERILLSAAWRPDSSQAHVGEPMTVDLRLSAQGLTAAQLPDLSMLWALPPGLKAYPDQAQLHDAAQGDDSVLGTREQTIALIADSAGRFTLPALQVQWWDTTTNQMRVTRLPARVLTILPAASANSASSAGSAASNASSTGGATGSTAPSAAPGRPPEAGSAAGRSPQAGAAPAAATAAAREPSATISPAVRAALATAARSAERWRAISLALGAAWILTVVVGWWWLTRTRRRRDRAGIERPIAAWSAQVRGQTHERASAPRRARAAFREACRRGDAPAARRELLAWAAAHWPESSLTGLTALAQRLDPSAAALLRELDRACYAGGSWDGTALARALSELPKPMMPAARQRAVLSSLYP